VLGILAFLGSLKVIVEFFVHVLSFFVMGFLCFCPFCSFRVYMVFIPLISVIVLCVKEIYV